MDVRPTIIAFTALMTLTACSSTGPAPPPEPAPPPPAPVPVPPSGDLDPFGYGKPVLAIVSEGIGFQGVGNFYGSGQASFHPIKGTIAFTGPFPDGEAIVSIGEANFSFPMIGNTNLVHPILGQPVSTLVAKPLDANGDPTPSQVAITALDYSFIGSVDVPAMSLSSSVFGGWETPISTLPEQLATYSGRFSGYGGTTGTFSAEADFAENDFLILLYQGDAQSLVGQGAGDISGNSFSSTFNITDAQIAAQNMTGELQGGFYGPGAEEIVGVYSGTFTGNGNPAAGTIMGLIGGAP